MTIAYGPIADKVAARLATKGAHAVALVGSVARGDTHEYSDIDLTAIGEGPDYALEVVDDVLVSITWRTPSELRDRFDDPLCAGGAVPSWRGARMLHDPNGVGASLQRHAQTWQWESIHAQCERAVANELVGVVEEIYRIVGLRRAGRRRAAAAIRWATVVPMTRSMAVHHRLFYDSENNLWDVVCAAMGHDWERDFDIAIGVERGAADLAVLSLFRQAAARADRVLTAAQRAVVQSAIAVSENAV